MQRRHLLLGFLSCMALAMTACTVGPQYQRPTVQVPSAYKELPPSSVKESSAWKVAQPKDEEPRGPWWEVFGEPRLNALAAQVDVSNQNIASAEAQFRNARAAIRVARADLFPTITGSATLTRSHLSANAPSGGQGSSRTQADYQLPLDLSYELDVWGRIRRNIESSIANAQATAADLETVRLSMQAELAVDYFSLQGLDGQKQLLDLTAVAFEKALELTLARYNQGVASQIDVAQARTQLETTRAQAIDVGVQRAQFEHAIAILIGKPPAELSIPAAPIGIQLPAIPAALPSELLERRPDIAAAERRVAVANAQIGIAQAAFFPTITLNASVGVASSSLANLFTWPSLLWAVGSSLTQTLFDAGQRKGLTDEARAAYDSSVATYRQTVLTAFQGVEDNLAALRILEGEAKQQDNAVKAAETSLRLAIEQYKGGIATYLQVITAQSAALTDEITAVNILTRRMTAAVQLIQALGGGWRA
jgi:NodT family efflux transporter outer membrane factor (OMF) lipoprotein